MIEHGPDRDPEERDQRAAEPPSESGDEESAGTDAPGPAGNPEVDEEALSHRQQDRD
jgi:hypothetical protein